MPEFIHTYTILTHEGVMSDRIDFEVDGVFQSIANTKSNWKALFALSTYSITRFFQKHTKWDGTEEITPWEESPTFLHRKKMFATV